MSSTSSSTSTQSSFVLIESLDSIKSLSSRSSTTSESTMSSINEINVEIADNQLTNECNEESYEVLTIAQMMAPITRIVEELKDVSRLSNNIVWNLIQCYKWDQKSLLRDITIDYKLVLKEQNVMSEDDCTDIEIEFCSICLILLDLENKKYGMNCNHFFCKVCWNHYLIDKIKSATHLKDITCADTSCQRLLDFKQVFRLLDDMSVKDTYIELMVKSFVDHSKNFRFCRNRECGHVFQMKKSDVSEVYDVECVCKTKMCFNCGQTSHHPIGCNLMNEWSLRMCSDLKQMPHQFQIKRCPECMSVFETFGPFNEIVCAFCCKSIDWTKAKNPFDKFDQYLMKFEISAQLVSKTTEIKRKIDSIQTYYLGIIELELIPKSLDTLIDCLHYIQLFNIFMYFTDRSDQFLIFENNCHYFERYVENLSEILEKITETQTLVLRSELLTSKQNCEKLRHSLIGHIVEGNVSDYWTYDFNDFIELYWIYNKD